MAACIAVSYNNGACYLKDTLMPGVDRTWIWSGRRTDIVVPVTPPYTGPTCVAAASDGETYMAASGATFQIICGVDYYGGDMGAVATANFQLCIDACDQAAGCVDVSYNGNTCYMKDNLMPQLTNGDIWTAKMITADTNGGTTGGATTPGQTTGGPATCGGYDDASTLIASTNSFDILCGIDYYGGDLAGGALYDQSFDDCINACDAKEACVDVSDVPVARTCYLKGMLNPQKTDGGVWTARKVLSTTSVPTTGTGTQNGASTLTCADGATNAPTTYSAANSQFDIKCFVDYAGGDFEAEPGDWREQSRRVPRIADFLAFDVSERPLSQN